MQQEEITENLVERAREFATRGHPRIDHLRRFSRQPYDIHLRNVAELVATVTEDPAVIAAAWLHDTVENTPATLDEIEREFGPELANLISELTDVSRPGDGNRARRRAIDMDHTAKASGPAQTVKLADLIDNCRNIVKNDPRLARAHLNDLAALLEVLTKGDKTLFQRAKRELGQGLDSLRRSLSHSRPAQPVSPSKPPEEMDGSVSTSSLPSFPREQRMVQFFNRAFTAEAILTPIEECPKPPTVWSASQAVQKDASFPDVIQILVRHTCCLVIHEEKTLGVINRHNLQDPIVRMWLFGLITVFEMWMSDFIELRLDEKKLLEMLSPERMAKVRILQQERQRRGQDSRWQDCLQFGDKAQLLLEEGAILSSFGFDSKNKARRAIKDLESLRNNLAHAQDIISYDWPQIIRLSRRFEELNRH